MENIEFCLTDPYKLHECNATSYVVLIRIPPHIYIHIYDEIFNDISVYGIPLCKMTFYQYFLTPLCVKRFYISLNIFGYHVREDFSSIIPDTVKRKLFIFIYEYCRREKRFIIISEYR